VGMGAVWGVSEVVVRLGGGRGGWCGRFVGGVYAGFRPAKPGCSGWGDGPSPVKDAHYAGIVARTGGESLTGRTFGNSSRGVVGGLRATMCTRARLGGISRYQVKVRRSKVPYVGGRTGRWMRGRGGSAE